MRTRGVLVIKPDNPRLLLVPEQRRHLDTFAALTAIALERVHYVEVAQQALISMESERLRNSLSPRCRTTCGRRLPQWWASRITGAHPSAVILPSSSTPRTRSPRKRGE